MASKVDITLHGPSVSIVRQVGSALSDVIRSKFGCVATINDVDFEGDVSPRWHKRPTVVQEKRFEVKHVGVKVSVWRADLTNFKVDAVVNAANERLQHYGGLALALSAAGGPQIQQESDQYIKKYGNLKTGDAVVTDAGSLPCKMIIHAVGPQLSAHPTLSEVFGAERLLEKAIRNILDRVTQNSVRTVAIPAISSGLFNYPLQECADTIVTVVKHFCERSTGHLPEEIMLVNHDKPTVKEMERACRKMLDPHQPMSYSQAASSKSRGDGKTSTAAVQLGNVNLTLKTGHIEEQQTDVIVNTIYNRDLSKGLISTAILQKAGNGIQKEIHTAPFTGYIIITNPYRLQCKEVYHTSWFDKEKGKDTVQEILFKSVSECLWTAVAKGHKSIAFPAIGTGGLNLIKKEVAQIMCHAVADFATKVPKKMEVYFVIFPSDKDTFKAFEDQMRFLQQSHHHYPTHSQPSFTHESEHRGDFQGRRAPEFTPQLSLIGPTNAATHEAKQWLHDLFECSGSVAICNNFIQHFGEQEHLQLSRLLEEGVSIVECFEKGRASIIVSGKSNKDVVVASLQVEAMLCNIQREFVQEEEYAMVSLLSASNVFFERKMFDSSNPEFRGRVPTFRRMGLWIEKVEKVENPSLKMLFDLKKNQLHSSTSQKMFQLMPAQFCDVVSHIGFHAEFAPPDDPAFGEGIYFTSTEKKAMEVWKEPNKEYLHFVEAEVLTGKSTRGKPGLILPPAVGKDPQVLYDSVSGGPEISVIFSGYQALPKYIVTCRVIKD